MQAFALLTNAGALRLSLRTRSETESDPLFLWYTRVVGLVPSGQSSPVTELQRLSGSNWYEAVYDLTPHAGSTVHIWLEFTTADNAENAHPGWYVDDVRLEALGNSGLGFCAGDGTSGTPCPCGNFGGSGRGCASSFNALGALIGSSGTPSMSADDFVLATHGVAESFLTFLQGNALAGNGQGTAFGDGLLCAGGNFTRLAHVFAPGGAASYPLGAQTPISIAGLVVPFGGMRVYQAWYRDSSLSYRAPGTFNMTNGLMATWRP